MSNPDFKHRNAYTINHEDNSAEPGLNESDIGKEPWINEQLIVYPNVEEYAIYELIDGWYQNHNLGGSFDGAPNPIEYIDLADFGADLISTGDTTICRELPNGKVVVMDCKG